MQSVEGTFLNSFIKTVLKFTKPVLFLVVIILVGLTGFHILANPVFLNMAGRFTPRSIEIDMGGGMQVLEFNNEEAGYIAGLLQYDSWEKAGMPYDLSTMTYIFDGEKKAIGLYEDVDGYTFIFLYRGFGWWDKQFYKAPPEVYGSIKQYLLDNYAQKDERTDKITVNDYQPLDYEQVRDFALQYSYDWGVILESDEQKKELLLYNHLSSKKIVLNHENKIENEEDVKLPEDLQGYSFYFKFGDSSQRKHLLGIRYNPVKDEKKMYSDLFIIDKDEMQHMTILQSYVLEYDPPSGRVSQGDIPTIIDFTVDVIEDYLVYQDTDHLWKVQDVRNGEIYSSGENETSLEEIQINYQAVGKYIYILEYVHDQSILAFDTDSKEFLMVRE